MNKQDFELRGDLRPEYNLPRITRDGAARPEYRLPSIARTNGARSSAVLPRPRQRAGHRTLPAPQPMPNAPEAPSPAALPPSQSTDDDVTLAYGSTLHEQYKPPAEYEPGQPATVAADRMVELDMDVATAFPTKESVNDALRLVIATRQNSRVAMPWTPLICQAQILCGCARKFGFGLVIFHRIHHAINQLCRVACP